MTHTLTPTAGSTPGLRPTPSARWSKYLLPLIFVVLFALAAAFIPGFVNWDNLSNVLQRNAIIGIVACGMLLMILLGGFDLSVGAVGAMSSVTAAALIINFPMALGITAALALGLAVGLFNGFLIARISISPFVATLGVQVLITGLLFVATDAQPVYGVPESFTQLGLGRIGLIPVPAILFAIVAVLTWVLLKKTTFGHHIYAVGGNRAAAKLAGIRVHQVIIVTYGLGGLLAALAGIVLLGTTGIGQPASAVDWPLITIAAVVVGGVPLSGGVGHVGQAVLGTLLLGVVANALNLMSVSPYWQPAVTGAVILLAVGMDAYHRHKQV